MKRNLLLGLLLSVSVLSACGGSNASTNNGNSSSGNNNSANSTTSNKNSSSGDNNSTTSTNGGNQSTGGDVNESKLGITLEELQKKDITVTFWHTMGAKNEEILNSMIKNFNKVYPNIKIDHAKQGGYDDIQQKILTAIPANNTPVMAFAYPDHVAEYIDAGASVLLNDYVNDPIIGFNAEDGISNDKNDGVDDFVEAFWKEGIYDSKGSVYSVPYTKSTEALFVNKTFLDKHNLPIPTKWENESDPNDLTAMINLCRKIKQIDNKVVPLGYDSDDNMYITLSKQMGIPYTSLNEDGTGNNDFGNAPEAMTMIKKIKGWYDEGLIVTKGTLPNNTYTSDKFTTQELIMSIGSTGGTSYNNPGKDSDGNYLFNAQVAPVPQYDSNNPAIISQGPSITFFKNPKIDKYQQAAAWVFYKYITNTDNTAKWAIATGYEPVRLSAYNSNVYQTHLNNLGTSKETLFTRVANMTNGVKDWYFTSPAFKGSATSRTQVGSIISTVCLNDLSNKSQAEVDKFVLDVFIKAYTQAELARG